MMLMVMPENGSFTGKKVINLVQPVIIGRLMDGQDANAPNTLKFNSKVVSRNHARLSYRDGKVRLTMAGNPRFIPRLTMNSFTFKIQRVPVALS